MKRTILIGACALIGAVFAGCQGPDYVQSYNMPMDAALTNTAPQTIDREMYQQPYLGANPFASPFSPIPPSQL